MKNRYFTDIVNITEVPISKNTFQFPTIIDLLIPTNLKPN